MRVRVSSGESLADALKKLQFDMDMPCGGTGSCGRCTVQIDGIGKVLACRFRQPGEYEVIPPEERAFDAVVFGKEESAHHEGVSVARIWERTDVTGEAFCSEQPEAADGCDYLAVMDLGTTTVVLGVFYQGQSGIFTFTNPQRASGADVMSRIRCACEGQGENLQRLITERVQSVLAEAENTLQIPAADGKVQTENSRMQNANQVCDDGKLRQRSDGLHIDLVLSANTTMQHLFEGLSCQGLGVVPFAPADISLHTYQLMEEAQESGNAQKAEAAIGDLVGAKRASQTLCVTALPGISTFVGADIVSGIYGLGMMQEERPVLLLDLGTNGEMALGCKEKLLVASTAAGPAFEGSELALQIHGAGVMRLLHQMLAEGVMDETGLLVDEYFEEGYPLSDVVRITQEDIRDLQMAKAAVFAGVRVLMEEYGITPEEVAKVYLAGGMGYYLDPQDAFAIGLLPKEFAGRTRAAGNTSYLGAVLYAADRKKGEDGMEQIVQMAREVVLSGYPHFEEYYYDAMNFPERETNFRKRQVPG